MRSKSRIHSFKYALSGITYLFKNEMNARIHLVAALLVTALGFTLKISTTEWILLTLTITIVICAEALNTAIEKVVDLASPELHDLAKHSKDVAAAGVLIASIGAVIVGLIIFIPKLI